MVDTNYTCWQSQKICASATSKHVTLSLCSFPSGTAKRVAVLIAHISAASFPLLSFFSLRRCYGFMIKVLPCSCTLAFCVCHMNEHTHSQIVWARSSCEDQKKKKKIHTLTLTRRMSGSWDGTITGTESAAADQFCSSADLILTSCVLLATPTACQGRLPHTDEHAHAPTSCLTH